MNKQQDTIVDSQNITESNNQTCIAANKDSRRGSKSNKNKNRTNGNNRSQGGRNYPRNNNNIPPRNDWEYYAATEEIAKSIANVPFNVMAGLPYKLDASMRTPTMSAIQQITSHEASGAVGTVRYIPSIGVTSSRTDSINMAAVQLYTYVRHANSGAKNYEAPDLMMEILAVKDIMTEIFECKRIIGITSYYNYYNHNLPDALLQALHINASDLRANLAQYRGRLNLLIEKFNSFAIPSYFKAFLRSAYISNLVFSDSDSIKGQMFLFYKDGYYTWSPKTSTTGTSLVYTRHTTYGNLDTLKDRLDIIEGQLDAMYLDEDAITMSGDILKAFRDSDLYKLTQIPEDYRVEPKFDEDILAQIENLVLFRAAGSSVIAGSETGTLSADITQSNQLIIWQPTYIEKAGSMSNGFVGDVKTRLFNSHKDNPDYRDTLEWSRLMCTFTTDWNHPETGDDTWKVTLTSAGLEVCIAFDLFSYLYTPDSSAALVATGFSQVLFATNSSSVTYQKVASIVRLMQYDWHPFIYLLALAGTTPKAVEFGGDIKNATIMAEDTITNINKSAVYAAFYARTLYSK